MHLVVRCAQELPEPQLDSESATAFNVAFDNIRAFHAAQQSPPLEVETMPGVRCRRVTRPIGKRTISTVWIIG
jgi:histidinol dehydrogenase